jgi:uncharacterized oligopeptide transporter (OPT) family protein
VQLLAWCSALAFFGVFVAVPLRHQTIIREKLRFPSGTATASVIRTLHGLPPLGQDDLDGSSSGSDGCRSCGSNAPAAATGSRFVAKQRQSDGAAAGMQVGAGAGTQNGLPAGSSGSNGVTGGSSGSSANTALQQVDLEVAVWAECEQEHVTLLGRQAAAAAGGSSSSSTLQQQQQWGRALRLLLWSFALSGAYSLAAAWVKPLR